MAKYIHLIKDNKEFNESSSIILPNVSFIENLDIVNYNKYSDNMLRQKPLTFRFISNGTFEIRKSYNINSLSFYYRYVHIRNGETINNVSSTTLPLIIEVLKGDEISINNYSGTPTFIYNSYHIYFGGTAKCIMYGNFSSLISTNYSTTSTWSTSVSFEKLFYNYSTMDIDPINFTFGKMTGITAPAAFRSCFAGCTSLTNFPILPFKTLPEHAYDNMFYGCKKLKKVVALFTTDITNTDLYTKNWLNGVSNEGLFIKSKNAEWDNTGPNGIPLLWKVGKYID